MVPRTNGRTQSVLHVTDPHFRFWHSIPPFAPVSGTVAWMATDSPVVGGTGRRPLVTWTSRTLQSRPCMQKRQRAGQAAVARSWNVEARLVQRLDETRQSGTCCCMPRARCRMHHLHVATSIMSPHRTPYKYYASDAWTDEGFVAASGGALCQVGELVSASNSRCGKCKRQGPNGRVGLVPFLIDKDVCIVLRTGLPGHCQPVRSRMD